MDCFEKFKCKGMCCYDGVYLSEDDIKKINECIDKYPNEFENKDYIEVSDWKDYKGMKKTKAIQLTRYREDYPKHFEQTRCIFQNEETGKCLLQEVAIKNNEDGWKYKPLTCCGFPLRKINGKVELIKNKEDDPSIYDDYDGYVSCLPCFNKIDINELNDEYSIMNKEK